MYFTVYSFITVSGTVFTLYKVITTLKGYIQCWCLFRYITKPPVNNKMFSLQSIVKRHNIAAAVLPDRYAQAVPAQAVFDVMERQVDVMRQYKQRCGAQGLPRHETWETFQDAHQ